jgi:hypothetical protein
LESGSGCGVDDAELVGDFIKFVLETAYGGIAWAMEGFELCGDVVAIDREVVGDGDELGEESPGGDEEESRESEDDDEGCSGAWEAEALELSDYGSEEEREKDCYSERKKEDLREVQDSDGEYGDGEEPEVRQKACGW